MSSFAPSVREQMRARIALQGPAGSGKTLTGMRLAAGLSPDGVFAVVDTERRALEYAQRRGENLPDRFDFLHTMPATADPAKLPGLIAEADRAGVGSLLIDSLSPYWSGTDGALDRVDRSRDKRAGWSEYRPVENAFREALLTFSGHLIVTMRVKTEYVTEYGTDGKVRVRRLGLKADQRDTIDYEFSIIGEMDAEHALTVVKTTCPDLVDRRIERPGVDLVETLRDWLGQGEPALTPRQIRDEAVKADTTVERLGELYRYAERRALHAAPVVDEIDQPTTLGPLLWLLAKQRKAAAAATGQEVTR